MSDINININITFFCVAQFFCRFLPFFPGLLSIHCYTSPFFFPNLFASPFVNSFFFFCFAGWLCYTAPSLVVNHKKETAIAAATTAAAVAADEEKPAAGMLYPKFVLEDYMKLYVKHKFEAKELRFETSKPWKALPTLCLLLQLEIRIFIARRRRIMNMSVLAVNNNDKD